MRRLVIMRHAKAERGHGKEDFDRALIERGWEDADRVAAAFTEAGVRPDRILCSASRRTRDTLSSILPYITGNCTVELRRDLYDADVPELREAMRVAEGDCVLLVGHNPAAHGLATLFSAGEPAARALKDGFPTATAAVYTMGFGIDTVRFERLFSP